MVVQRQAEAYFFCIHLKICYYTCALDEVSKFSGVYEKVDELQYGEEWSNKDELDQIKI